MQATLLNRFDRKFRELERRTGSDASKIEWLVKNSADIRRLVGTLYLWETEFKRYIFDETHVEVPTWFLSRFREYNKKYEPEIHRIYGKMMLLALAQDRVDGVPSEEIFRPEGRPYDSDHRFDYFDPATCDAVDAIEFVWHYVYETSDGSTRDKWLDEELRRGVEAWDYFTETIGVDFSGVDHRWRKLPRALVPIGRPNPASNRQKAVLFELLREAAKAYVFGLPAASMAMCRAVCDTVLRTYCEPGECEGKSLGRKVIPMAEKRYDWLKTLNLKAQVDLANKVMHEADRPLTDKEDETVRQFLETIKALIEQAPRPTTDQAGS